MYHLFFKNNFMSFLTQIAACFQKRAIVVALLLAYGASTTILNKAGLNAKQEANGEAVQVFAEFEKGVCLSRHFMHSFSISLFFCFVFFQFFFSLFISIRAQIF